MTEATDKVNSIFTKYESRMKGMFHNALWQLLVNRSIGDTRGAFIRIPSHEGIAIAVETGGYIDGWFDVADDHKSETDAILEELNADVFGLSPVEADKVIAASMRYHSHG